MKKDYNNISDDEIRIISDTQKGKGKKFKALLWITPIVILLAGLFAWFTVLHSSTRYKPEEAFFEPDGNGNSSQVEESVRLPLTHFNPDTERRTFCETFDTTINDVGLHIFIPHNATATLHLGPISSSDNSIVYAAQAADIRADNGKILGAFVLAGKPLAWGLSKKGYCAIIGDSIFVGVSKNSPLFEEATEKGGYFFRQYPLVDKGKLVESELKNKSERRAICQRKDETFMVHSTDKESFHDFTQALVDLGVDNAVYLVGSAAYGWAVDQDGNHTEWGETIMRRIPENTSYIVWRKPTGMN